jgi:hypothetical protein
MAYLKILLITVAFLIFFIGVFFLRKWLTGKENIQGSCTCSNSGKKEKDKTCNCVKNHLSE